jgi:inhibitor of KinA
MSVRRYRIFPLSDSALTVEFGQKISLDLNEQAIQLAANLERSRFPGFVEAVPAYSTTTIFYEIDSVRAAFPEYETAFEAVRSLVESFAANCSEPSRNEFREMEIPVDFGGEDLNVVAEFSGLSTSRVVEIFLSRQYRVYMLGFLPGFAYMGEVDERIAVPRRATPRTKVPKGSVGIAGKQTGIYPFESPGGWQIIGHTSIEMFAPDREQPCLLRPGDIVRFKAIDE